MSATPHSQGPPLAALRSLVTGLFAVCTLLPGGMAARAEDGEDPAGSCTDDAIIVFDASGSMQRLAYSGETRLTLARAAARVVVPAAASVRRLGLVVYEPGRASHCANIDLKVAPQYEAAPLIMSHIEDLRTGGETPLTAAVEGAADVLDYKTKPATIVVLTDGDENCGGDPCATGRRLAAGARTRVHVVSFRVGTVPRFRAACLAEETGGLFVPTETLDELTEALTRVLACPRISVAPELNSRGSTAPTTSR